MTIESVCQLVRSSFNYFRNLYTNQPNVINCVRPHVNGTHRTEVIVLDKQSLILLVNFIALVTTSKDRENRIVASLCQA